MTIINDRYFLTYVVGTFFEIYIFITFYVRILYSLIAMTCIFFSDI